MLGLIGVPAGAESAAMAAPKRTILVLDASGSMWGRIDGRAKIDIAREVIGDLVAKLPDDAELGLVAYGHRRKGDCKDIELLVPPAKLDREAFLKIVNGLQPKGMTPLTSAVEFAAEGLTYTENEATVILVTDGEETCDRDPCEAAAAIEKAGVKFTAHVIAFDLTAEAAKSVECMATQTGGLFLKADNASTLTDALEMTIRPEEPEPEKLPDPADATVKGPESVEAGSLFSVEWTGPDERGDYITIVPAGMEDGRYRNYEYARRGSPLKLTALIEPGDAELRYVHGRTSKVLGRAAIRVVEAEVALSAPASAIAGADVPVEWKGPGNRGDYVTIVAAGTEDGKYADYTYTEKGKSPVKVTAPVEAGPAEIRYMAGQGDKVLARRPITLEKADVTLTGPERVTAGAEVSVEWTGPANRGDYITIVPAGTEDGKYAKYAYTEKGKSPVKVTAPVESGPAEIRYMAAQDDKVLARRPITLEKAEVTLKAQESAVAGSTISIEWTGPDNKGDFITVVPKDFEDGKYAKYAYTNRGNPAEVIVPQEAGECEIRYTAAQDDKVLARLPLEVEAAVVTLKAPETAVAGSSVAVEWTGPDNKGDFITIVVKDTEDGKYNQYTYTARGNPAKVIAPIDAGECEIRYMAAQGNEVLARIPLATEVARVEMKAPATVVAGSDVAVSWIGPDNDGDYITIVPKDTEDGKYKGYQHTRRGASLKIEAPAEAGPCEIRYMSGQGDKVLARVPLEVTPAAP